MLYSTGQVCQGHAGERSCAQTPPPATLATHPLCFQVPCEQKGKKVTCTFEFLKPSTQYCVRTVTKGMDKEQIREAEQCLVTPASPAGRSSSPALMLWFHLRTCLRPRHMWRCGLLTPQTFWSGLSLVVQQCPVALGRCPHHSLWACHRGSGAGGDTIWGPSTLQPAVTSWQAFPGSLLPC